MKLIAHRGLLYGPDKSLENSPTQIEKALAMGFDVEVDLWASGILHNEFWLGHDEPRYRVTREFLERDSIWVHCKNHDALTIVTPAMHYFWHQSDDYTITSRGMIWVYPGNPLLGATSVEVMPEWEIPDEDKSHIEVIMHRTIQRSRNYSNQCGICSDYIGYADECPKDKLDARYSYMAQYRS